jgi:hypothetical protein
MTAAQSTIAAVLYSLRGGTAVLSRDDLLRVRLADVDESQLREIVHLLQKRDGRIAPPWSDDEIIKLLKVWVDCHG